MKILLLGKSGQLGAALQHHLPALGAVTALNRHSETFCADLTQPNALRETIQRVQPHIIVNAAAYTAVDKAEQEQALAHQVNAVAPGIIAEEAARIGAWLVHYSTDYVFSGEGTRPWRETDAPHPLSVYGKTKLAGEQAIQASNCQHLIFRTSWVYGAQGQNFAATMLKLGQERAALSVVNDQFGAPTSTALLAQVTVQALSAVLHAPQLGGLYHLAAKGETSWHGYAVYLFEQARKLGLPITVAPEAVQAVSTAAFGAPAPRPANSRLNTEKLCHAFGLTLPHWQEGVAEFVADYAAANGKL